MKKLFRTAKRLEKGFNKKSQMADIDGLLMELDEAYRHRRAAEHGDYEDVEKAEEYIREVQGKIKSLFISMMSGAPSPFGL